VEADAAEAEVVAEDEAVEVVSATVGAPPAAAPTFGAVVVDDGPTARLVEPGQAAAPAPAPAPLVARTSSPGGNGDGSGRTESSPAGNGNGSGAATGNGSGGVPRASAPSGSGPAAAGPPLRVLLVEDDPGDAALLLALIGSNAEARVESTLHAAQAAAADFQPDVVLLDLDLPDSHGLATITRWCFADKPGVVVVTSGDYTDVTEARGREQGVADFLPKSRIGELLDAGESGRDEVLSLLLTVTGRA
jgi:CheY-like chemotaxis protein